METTKSFAKSLALVVGLCGALAVSGLSMAAKQAPSKAVDINKAGIEELATIPGLGETKAKAIVAYRETAPFKSVDELVNVKGIGEKLFAKISPYVTISGASQSTAVSQVAPPREPQGAPQQSAKPGTTGK